MVKGHTYPSLVTLLVTRLNEWRRRRRRTIIHLPTEIDLIQLAQDEIGWEEPLNGNMALQWKETQHQYYIALVKRNTGRRWVRLLIQKMWEVAWDQWEHHTEVVHRQENLVSMMELVNINTWIHEDFRLG
jgi:hypothetical protein